jgi:hypothetical protein
VLVVVRRGTELWWFEMKEDWSYGVVIISSMRLQAIIILTIARDELRLVQ